MGESYDAIGREFGLSAMAIWRHQENHLQAIYSDLRDATKSEGSIDLLDAVEDCIPGLEDAVAARMKAKPGQKTRTRGRTI